MRRRHPDRFGSGGDVDSVNAFRFTRGSKAPARISPNASSEEMCTRPSKDETVTPRNIRFPTLSRDPEIHNSSKR
jgi:hypothetical protein